MKKNIPPKYTLLAAVVSYGLSYLMKGIIGEALAVLGLIFLALGIVGLITEAYNRKKVTRDDSVGNK